MGILYYTFYQKQQALFDIFNILNSPPKEGKDEELLDCVYPISVFFSNKDGYHCKSFLCHPGQSHDFANSIFLSIG